MRRPLRLLSLVVSGLILSGCNSGVTTQVRVTSASQSSITLGVTFQGEAASKIASTPSLLSSLEHDVDSRLGQNVQFNVSGSSVSWSGPVTYQQLTSNSDVTGIQSAALAAKGTGAAEVTLQLVPPSAIVTAIEKGVAGQPRAAALAATMETYTFVTVEVSFPGQATLVSSSGPSVTIQGNTARVSQNLSSYGGGTVVVAGSLRGPSVFSPVTIAGGIAGLVVLGWFASVLSSRRRRIS